jgi:phage tail-like protein
VAAVVVPLTPNPSDRATAKAAGRRSPDPVGELRFKVYVHDMTIGQFSECSGLSAEWEILEYQEGGQDRFVHKLRSRLKYPNLILKRGVTYEDHFLKWFFEARKRDQRGTLRLTLLGEDGEDIREWAFAAAFPVKWTGPSLNAKSTNVATEALEVAHAGLEPQI